MTGKPFQIRLKAAMRGGNFTVADLARWFEVPYQTVRGWVQDGHLPAGGELDREEVYLLLTQLERMVKQREGLPLSRMNPAGRIAAVAAMRSRALRQGGRDAG